MTDAQFEIVNLKKFSESEFNTNFFDALFPNKILVVFLETKHFLSDANRFVGMLSHDEKQHFSRLAFSDLKYKYALHRGILRTLLSNMLDTKPELVELETSRFGKPRLRTSFYRRDIRFNVSHSPNYGLYAFSLGREVGVDIEECRSDLPVVKIAELILTVQEYEDFLKLSSQQQQIIFFELWTKKEAFSKAVGKGLFLDFQRVHLGIAKNHLSFVYGEKQLFDLSHPPNFFAALAVDEWS